MARSKRVRIFLDGQEVGTGHISDDGKTVDSVRFNPNIPEEDRARLIRDRELKLRERQKRSE